MLQKLQMLLEHENMNHALENPYYAFILKDTDQCLFFHEHFDGYVTILFLIAILRVCLLSTGLTLLHKYYRTR